MTDKPINLARARKDRIKYAARRQADANAASHGRTRAQKLKEAATDRAAKAHLDAHKREPE